MELKVFVITMLLTVQALPFNDGVCICKKPGLLTPTMIEPIPVPESNSAGQCTCENSKLQEGTLIMLHCEYKIGDRMKNYSLDFLPLLLAGLIISRTEFRLLPSRPCGLGIFVGFQLVLMHFMCIVTLTTQTGSEGQLRRWLSRTPVRPGPIPSPGPPVNHEMEAANIRNPALDSDSESDFEEVHNDQANEVNYETDSLPSEGGDGVWQIVVRINVNEEEQHLYIPRFVPQLNNYVPEPDEENNARDSGSESDSEFYLVEQGLANGPYNNNADNNERPNVEINNQQANLNHTNNDHCVLFNGRRGQNYAMTLRPLARINYRSYY